MDDDFPLYEMQVGHTTYWVPLISAGRLYAALAVHVDIGGKVLDMPGATREITGEERAKISAIADEWDAAK